jgi:fumarylacetoacetate (FAA) hydrolase family protein
MSTAPDESPATVEECQRQIEALEDAIHRDAVKLNLYVKELEQTLHDERDALAKFARVQETKRVRETRVEEQRAQFVEKEVKLEALRQGHARLRQAKVPNLSLS